MSRIEHHEIINTEKAENTKKKMTAKQLAAIIGIVLLVLLYLVTLIVAFVDQSASKSLFQVCLFGTVAIPLLIWIYIWMYGKLTQKHTMADLDIGKRPSDSAKKPEG